ncbi:hypothetical protein PSU4_37400 [Pseudonocardia sulfidoxydans NBRC 16205]|uniref:Uncharacterized protein n=1 Tax=Pseudonocardia sulfidoxydans NBRC 16205 TaxID=1223511 RepID=A0A511DJ02_9PSEU|nr:hypothetical protein [Pseudonocardia sulfidoxydans]GEL24786.1 hypothetical protein PSU4_37400 [Pseudonocardia sulfidoxydans NBRC 16205]
MTHVHAKAGAALGTVVAGGIAGVRSYNSTQHRWAAHHFARLAADFEADHIGEARPYWQQWAYVDAAIAAAHGFLEAYINEIYADAADPEIADGAHNGLSERTVASMTGYWKAHHETASVLTKYRMARIFATGAAGDDGRRPNEDVKLLIELRNWLVHFKPKTLVGGAPAPKKSLETLRTRYSDNRIFEGVPASWFPHVALSAGCARWAIESAEQYVGEFIEDVGGTRTHHRLDPDPPETP